MKPVFRPSLSGSQVGLEFSATDFARMPGDLHRALVTATDPIDLLDALAAAARWLKEDEQNFPVLLRSVVVNPALPDGVLMAISFETRPGLPPQILDAVRVVNAGAAE